MGLHLTGSSVTQLNNAFVAQKHIAIDVSAYGTLDPTGATDMGAIFRSAYADAVTAASNGYSAEVVIPAGTFQLSTQAPGAAGATALTHPANLAGGVTLRGPSRGATTLKLGGTATSLIGPVFTDVGNPSNVFKNLSLRHFTVDGGSISGSGCVLQVSGIISVDTIDVRYVNTINGGTPGTGASNHGNVIISLGNSVGVTTYTTARRIRVRNCRFGLTGGGGSYGINIQVLVVPNNTFPTNAQMIAGSPNAYGWIDDVILEDVHWTSGLTTFQGVTLPPNGAGGIMVGGNASCGKVRIRDCHVEGSLDVGYEVDSAYDVILSGCRSVDARNSHIYLRNLGGWPNGSTQEGASGASVQGESRAHWQIEDCTFRDKLLAQAATASTQSSVSQTVGVFAHVKDWGQTAGTLEVRNVKYVADGDGSVWTGASVNHNMHRIVGGFRRVVLENLTSVVRGFTGVQSRILNNVALNLQNGRGTLRARNIGFEVVGSFTNVATQNSAWANLLLNAAADYVIDVDDVWGRYAISDPAGNVRPNVTEVSLTPSVSTSDSLNSAASFTQGWRNDLTGSSQALTDFTAGSNKLTPNAHATAEHRLTQVKNENGGDTGMVGPYTDGCHIITCTPPTTPATGYKQGVRLKVDGTTGANSVHCYVAFDGTNYSINVDTEVAGALTNRATTVIGTGPLPATFWVRGIIRGNTVAADYFTSSTAVPSGAGASAATYTLTSGDGTLALFGAGSDQGYPGLVWTPVDSGSTTAAFNSPVLSVLRGRIGGVVPLRASGLNNHVGVQLPTNPSSWLRIPSQLDLEAFDMAASKNVIFGTLTEAPTLTDSVSSYVTQPVGQAIKMRNWRWQTPPAVATVSATGSPMTYTNADGRELLLFVTGGTVSSITLTRKNGSASASLGTTLAGLPLGPGDAVTITYTVAPTITKVPVL